MPRQKHYYGLNHLHFLTRSTYRRARVFDSERFRQRWVQTLGDLRRELDFKRVAGTAGFAVRGFCFQIRVRWSDGSSTRSMGRMGWRVAVS